MRLLLPALLLFTLTACGSDSDEAAPPPIRGLITTEVSATEDATRRRFPGVLEPGELNVLAFEVGGKLGRIGLSVGERVESGQVLAQLDDAQFRSTVENRRAAVEAVAVRLAQAEEDLERSEDLLQRGAGTRVRRDQDRTTVRELRAELTQAEQSFAEAQEDLSDTVMTAPFDGIVSALEVDSFATVASGRTILSLYEASAFEVSFFVSFEVASRLVVGTPTTVRLADDPDVALDAVVSELGERADTVSSFPVVVRLTETAPIIKAGMAVEVSFELAVPRAGDRAGGFLIPISAVVAEGEIDERAGPDSVQNAPVFVYDPETSTVTRREITFAGLRGNNVVVIDGLTEGERVASKGVAFLREGMPVKLLERED
ncbi:MAG: efflux RND transporter periplasmic adaptor subunit [Pseudomonadota bacterium]